MKTNDNYKRPLTLFLWLLVIIVIVCILSLLFSLVLSFLALSLL